MTTQTYYLRRTAGPTKARVRTLGIAWAALGGLLALFYPAAEWPATVGLLMIFQAFCGVLTWQRFRLTREAVLPDFLTMFLFNQFITKILTALGLVTRANTELAGSVGSYIQDMGENIGFEYQFQAELVFLLATLIFTFTWRALEGRRLLAIWHEPDSKVVWWIFWVGLAVYIGLYKLPFGASLGMTQELFRLFAIGAIAILLGGRSDYALGKRKSVLAILALSPLFILALSSGMKGEVALVATPILLPVFRRMNTPRFAFLVGFIVFVVLFLFPFSQTWRDANWSGRENVGIKEVATRVVDSWSQNGFLETAARSTAHWLSRGSSSEAGGLVMQLAERDGFIGPVLLEGLATIFIPRFLWPDKPRYMPGAWFTWYLGKADSPETATTSTAMILPTELYWMFGIAGVVIGIVFLSFLYFRVWRYLLQKSTTSLISLCALFALLSRSTYIEGIHTIYAISSPIILLVYVLIFDMLQKILLPKLSQLSISRVRH